MTRSFDRLPRRTDEWHLEQFFRVRRILERDLLGNVIRQLNELVRLRTGAVSQRTSTIAPDLLAASR